MQRIVKNWQSSQEIIEIRRNKHRRLCQAITLIGSIILMFFSFLSLTKALNFLSISLLTCGTLGFINTYYLFKAENIELFIMNINVVLTLLCYVLVVTGGIDGTGILWVYPIVAIIIFINPLKIGIKFTSAIIIVSAVILLSPLLKHIPADYSNLEIIRFLMSLVALKIMCAVEVSSEEKAYGMLIKLHDNDVHKLIFYDSLTGLSNRVSLEYNLDKLLIEKNTSQVIALLFIDLDNFKLVNDNYGHEVGDKLLHDFALRLKEIVRPFDLIANNLEEDIKKDDAARLAGDEFVIVLNDLKDKKEAGVVADRILKIFDGGYEMDGETFPVFASIGIAVSPDDTIDPKEMIQFADAAMYEAKRKGNNNHEFFNQNIANSLHQKLNIEVGLKKAVQADAFNLVYLPIFDCINEELAGVEALIRCTEPELKYYGPDSYIPIAESIGLIKKIDKWVIENSIKEFREVQQVTGFKGKLNINISGTELLDTDFVSYLIKLFEDNQFPISDVDIEIIETSLVPENQVVINNLNELKKAGFSLALDDFGTGYTSFNQLIMYPATSLKIDRSFINDLFTKDEEGKRTVQIIHNLAKNYDLKIVAEGVENIQQVEYLKSIGCDYLQGYYFSPPVSKQDLIHLIEKMHDKKELLNSSNA